MNTAQTQAPAPRDQYFSDFSAALRYWRDKRGFSQLRLSTESDISQRHISFLESGRSRPSKELILKLGVVLEIPLRQRNVMLLAAGSRRPTRSASYPIPNWRRSNRRSTSCWRSRRRTRRWWSTACGT